MSLRSPRPRSNRAKPATGWIPGRWARSESALRSRWRPSSSIRKKEVLCYYGDGSFGMTAWDMETAQRFGLPYLAVIGNNSAMNQIRCGQIGKYGPERGCVGNKLGDVDFEKFAECFGGWGIAVREPGQIRPALEKARERVAGGQCAIVNIWVDINEYAPGTKAQTMYK